MNATVEETMTNAIEVRINGGAWVTLISGGSETGSVAGLIAADTVEVRHNDNPVTPISRLFLELDFGGGGVTSDGWAVLGN